MKEINRFSFENHDTFVRNTVFIDDDGFYHINQDTFCDPGKVDGKTGLPTPTTSREDIHGRMNSEAYINWLAKALFKVTYVTAVRPQEKQWMIHE